MRPTFPASSCIVVRLALRSGVYVVYFKYFSMRKATRPVPWITKGSKIQMHQIKQVPYLTAVWRILLMPDLQVQLLRSVAWYAYIISRLLSWHIECISFLGRFWGYGFPYFVLYNVSYFCRSCPCGCLFVHLFNLIFLIAIWCKIHSQHEHSFIWLKVSEW